MRKERHSTLNIQYSTPNDSEIIVRHLSEGGSEGRKFDREDRFLEFASAVLDLSESLPETRAGNHLAGRLRRSGTSPFPNHGEAGAPESRDGFIHKLKICLKELRETRRWTRLIKLKAWVKNDTTLLFVLGECDELIRILHASIQTTKRNAWTQVPAIHPHPLLRLQRWTLNVEG